MLSTIKQKSDIVGALASTLCMIHCVATPFIFIASACSKSCCSSAPTWWKWLDFIFLLISFLAIRRTTRTTSKNWIKPALWCSWALLTSLTLIEQSNSIHHIEYIKYFAAFLLIGLHLFNLKFCQCNSNKCCTHHG